MRNKPTLTILQLNDTHGYLEPHPELFWDGDRADYRTPGGYARLRSVFEKVRAEREGAKARSTDTSNAIALDQHPNTMKAAPALFPPSPTGRCVADARPVCTRT